MMAEPGRGVSNGPNARPLDDTVAETGHGIADDAVLEGELGPGELAEGSEAALQKLQEAGWVTSSTLAAEAESEAEAQAHPS